jgi:hypothetical protein
MTIMELLIAALVIAGWLGVWIGSQRSLKRECGELRLEFQGQIEALSAKLKALEQTADNRMAAAASSQAGSNAAQEKASTPQAADAITPETLAALTETIATLLGRKVRIRSVKMMPMPNANINPWAQQGRVVIQASHNLRGFES